MKTTAAVATVDRVAPQAQADDPGELRDEALAGRIRNGDPGAESQLVERFGPAIRRFLGATTRDRATADDLFQETFSLALVKLRRGDLRSPEALLRYLLSLARNLARYHYRRSAVRDRRETPLADDAAPSALGPDPLEEVLAAERVHLLRSAVAELSRTRDRELLLGYYLDGESKGELCRRLDLGDENFKRVLYRARERCRRRLETQVGPSPDPGH